MPDSDRRPDTFVVTTSTCELGQELVRALASSARVVAVGADLAALAELAVLENVVPVLWSPTTMDAVLRYLGTLDGVSAWIHVAPCSPSAEVTAGFQSCADELSGVLHRYGRVLVVRTTVSGDGRRRRDGDPLDDLHQRAGRAWPYVTTVALGEATAGSTGATLADAVQTLVEVHETLSVHHLQLRPIRTTR